MFFPRLKELRVDKKMTQEQIANILGCKREVYRRYEVGERDVPVWVVLKLCRYYETTPNYVLGVSDEK